MINIYPFTPVTPKSFNAYPKSDFDLESTSIRNPRKIKHYYFDNYHFHPIIMIKSLGNKVMHYYKLHPLIILLIFLSFGIATLIFLSISTNNTMNNYGKFETGLKLNDGYLFGKMRNLVMVAGHSVYTSSSCGKVDEEGSWLLEPYQRNRGQAATFVAHIKEGVEAAAGDEEALLLFSGGETRKDAGPRSEAQSYGIVAESKGWFVLELGSDILASASGPAVQFSVHDISVLWFLVWFGLVWSLVTPVWSSAMHSSRCNDHNTHHDIIGNQEKVRWKALTEEHARDSFENLLFSVCRFRELTGSYPQNITVVGYDFKKERFVNLHRSAIRFPESQFFYLGTPAAASSREAALKGEALVRTQFEHDPYACLGSLRRKKIGRDPFHRSIPYPNGCPEIEGLFRYCKASLYTGSLPWA
ncbi:hypothetical protein M8C21_002272 [Ambrosia artemisiifolia]|uniref:Uncharacterized protein n=1 Tax=Ambrosia artemisiifolia TaxID=4212 RepID=A0AAD5CV30_AMBAR|nr:hypothetical protein M8C21_002272 [Ambrosia artemisiifolia]